MNPLEKRVAELEQIIRQLIRSDRYNFDKNLQFENGRNIQLGRTTGTKIGTATDQKLGFFGATPIAGNAAILNIPFPVTAADLYNALNTLGLVYHT